MISQIILFKDAQNPLVGNPNTDWRAWSNAYTSMTFEVPFDKLKKPQSVAVQIVFTAAAGLYETGVGVFASPADPNAPMVDWTKATMLAEFAANDPVGSQRPHPYRADIIDQFNMLIDDGQLLYLAIATWGNGTKGPSVFNAELRIIW